MGFSMSSYKVYESEKRAWLLRNPNATQAQIELAFKAIAWRLGI
jgi:hypothetical protein